MSQTDDLIRLETKHDYVSTEALVRRAFWNVYRPGCMEHFVLHCLREDPAFVPELDLVLERSGILIGQICFVRAAVQCENGTALPVLNAGPLCIAPEFQRQGLGKLLLDAALEKAALLGYRAVVLEGDPAFYGQSGFVPGKCVGVRYADDPEADYFLVKELQPGAFAGVSGTYRDPEGYFVCLTHPQEFEAFERCFPALE